MDLNDAMTVYLVVAAIVCAIIAFEIESRRKRRGIGVRAYTWGYYNGCVGIALMPLAILWLYVAIEGHEAGLFVVAAWPIVQTVCGYYVLRRHRGAFVVGTILSFNPILWIVNYFYIRHRWNELRGPNA